MSKRYCILLISLLSFLTSLTLEGAVKRGRKRLAHSSASVDRLGKGQLTHAINQIVHPVHKKAAVGIKIVSLKNDAVLYQKNPDQLFIPASNTKLITGAAALGILGPEFKFETQLATDAQNNALKIHNLYLKGGGDPTLETSHLEEMVKKLRARGIREIRGNIIIDASCFTESSRAPGWNKNDGPIFDMAPTNGLMLNHCCVTVRIKPARIPGHKPQVHLDPAVDYITIVNNARTTLSAKKRSLHVSRARSSEKRVIVTGTIATKSKPKAYFIVLDNPHIYAAQVLKNLLKKEGIAVRGSILMGTTPQNVHVLVRHHSEPLSQLVRYMNKSSDNLYADALFKKMGEVTFEAPGSWARGKKAVEAFLSDEVGISTVSESGKLEIFDGSGLSHHNRVSPNHFEQLLSWMYKKSEHKNIFIDSLPISGVDGTLHHRMRHKHVVAKVKAKTGSLPGISSLAGYITPKQGGPLLFVIIANREKKKSAFEFRRKLEDHLCSLLATHSIS